MIAASPAVAMRALPVGIGGVGLCTPLGLVASRTWSEMSAGTLRYRETEVPDPSSEPARAARLGLLPEDATRQERAQALLLTALEEILPTIRRSPPRGCPLLLVLPAPGGPCGPPLLNPSALAAAIREAARAAGCPLRGELSETFHGRHGGFLALAAAMELLAAGRAPAVLIGSVDSLCDPEMLRHLARNNRLLGRSNPDGLLPGEGAGFVLLVPLDRCAAHTRPLAALLGTAIAQEPRPYSSREPSHADGLTAALRALRENPITGSRRARWLVHGQSGETFWARELARAYLRNAALCPEPFRPYSIAAALGDTGAAAGIIALIIAVQMSEERRRADRAGGRVLVYGCSEEGELGACVLDELP